MSRPGFRGRFPGRPTDRFPPCRCEMCGFLVSMRIRGAVIACLLAMIGLGIAASPAVAAIATPARFAHAALASTYPADGSVVRTQPEQVTASFDQPVRMTANSLVVYSPGGQRADDGRHHARQPGGDRGRLLPGLGNGTYTAVWHVISDDTHPVEGEFTFSDRRAERDPRAGPASVAQQPGQRACSRSSAGLSTCASRCSAAAVAFLIVCWPDGARRRGVIRLVTYSWAGLLLSTLLGLLIQGPYAANGAQPGAQRVPGAGDPGQQPGHHVAGARADVASWPAGRRRCCCPGCPTPGGAPGRAYGVGVGAADHRGRRELGGVRPRLHRCAGAVAGSPPTSSTWTRWRSGSAGWPCWPGSRCAAPADEGVADRACPGSPDLARPAWARSWPVGAYQTWREVGAWQALFDTSYGRLILAKIAGLLVLIALGYLARHYIQRGLRPPAPAAGRLLGAPPGRSADPVADRSAMTGRPVHADAGADAAIDAGRPGDPASVRYDDSDLSRAGLAARDAAAAPLGGGGAAGRRGDPRVHGDPGQRGDRAGGVRADVQPPASRSTSAGRPGRPCTCSSARPGSGRTRSTCTSPARRGAATAPPR